MTDFELCKTRNKLTTGTFKTSQRAEVFHFFPVANKVLPFSLRGRRHSINGNYQGPFLQAKTSLVKRDNTAGLVDLRAAN